MKKVTDIVYKAIDYAGYALVLLFMFIFGLGAIIWTVVAVIEKDPFNLIGTVSCGFIYWVARSLIKG